MNWFKLGVISLMVFYMCGCSSTSKQKAPDSDVDFVEQQKKRGESEVKLALKEQQESWNRGDLEGFMALYSDSDILSFVTSKGITKGNDDLLERYKKSYPDKESMGELEFELLEYKPLGINHAMVIGTWRLIRQNDSPNGYFSLLWENTAEGWRIINDHTS